VPSLAAIDIGTNSVRLLITDALGHELVREMHITRLGQGVDQTGRLAPDAIARTLHVLSEYAALLRQHTPYRLRMTATSAARDSSNRLDFFRAVANTVGQEPELLSGADEARLSFLGACADLPSQLAPFLIFDIGGGSTEFALGSVYPEQFLSVDMGGVRITERFLKSDPPLGSEIALAEQAIDALLNQVATHVDTQKARTWLGLAGTVTTFASYTAGLSHYDPAVTHGYILTRADIETFTDRLLSLTADERKPLLLEPKRAEVIVGGALVLRRIMQRFEIEQLRTSERDILDGLASSLR
jgi:exopolyphosphatase / guanosine-5'-triphosphate,3'-diphosphate pyrophosphatase